MPPANTCKNRTVSRLANTYSSVETASEETTSTYIGSRGESSASSNVGNRFEDDRTRISDDDDIVVLAHRNLIYRDDKIVRWPEEDVVDDFEDVQELVVDDVYRQEERKFRHHVCEVGGCTDARCAERRGKSVGEVKITRSPRLEKISKDVAEMKAATAAAVVIDSKRKELVQVKDVTPKPKADLTDDDTKRRKRLSPEEIRKKVTKGFVLKPIAEQEQAEEERGPSSDDTKKKHVPEERKEVLKLPPQKETAGPEDSEIDSTKETDQKPQLATDRQVAVSTSTDETKRKQARDLVIKQKPPPMDEPQQKSPVMLSHAPSVVGVRKGDFLRQEVEEKRKSIRQKLSEDKRSKPLKDLKPEPSILTSAEPKRKKKADDVRRKAAKDTAVKRTSAAPLSRRYSKPRKALTRGHIRRKVTKGMFLRPFTDEGMSESQGADTRGKGTPSSRSQSEENRPPRPEGGRSAPHEDSHRRSTDEERLRESADAHRALTFEKKKTQHKGLDTTGSDPRESDSDSTGASSALGRYTGTPRTPLSTDARKEPEIPSDMDDIVQRATWAGSAFPVRTKKQKKEADKLKKKAAKASDQDQHVSPKRGDNVEDTQARIADGDNLSGSNGSGQDPPTHPVETNANSSSSPSAESTPDVAPGRHVEGPGGLRKEHTGGSLQKPGKR